MNPKRLAHRVITVAITIAMALLIGTLSTPLSPKTFAHEEPHEDIFETEQLIVGLDQPVAIDFAADGSMYILERGAGDLRVVLPGKVSPESTPVLQLTAPGLGEQGVHGFALDPNFASNGYVYVFQTKDDRDQVSRYTLVNNTLVSGSETTIWRDNQDVGEWHHGGGIAFGADGTIYLSTGDHHDTNYTSSHVSQRLDSYRGKILRLNLDGSIPEDNPFYDGDGPNLDAIWAIGLRNPYRITLDAETDTLYIGDVGGNDTTLSREELNVGTAGANYGWPLCEGETGCPLDVTTPLFSYGHDGRDASITGGFVYRNGTFPAEYEGSYFYADYSQNWIRRLTFGPDGQPTNHFFQPADGATDGPLGDIVDLKQGPDGSIYYVDVAIDWSNPATKREGNIRRVKHNARGPVIHSISADNQSGPGPQLEVTFTADVTHPDNDTLTYAWDFGDGGTSTVITPVHTFQGKGAYQVRLQVTDTKSSQAVSDILLIEIGQQPVAKIDMPADGTSFRAGDVISFSGSATDADSTLTAEDYTWSVLFTHEDHVHPVLGPIQGVTASSFTVPYEGHSYNSDTGYRIALLVTDEDGLTDTDSVNLTPDKVNLSFQTTPPGLHLGVDQITQDAPIEMSELKGFHIEVTAPEQQYIDGKIYDFVAWSHGVETPEFELVVPNADASFMAEYTQQQAAPDGSLFFDGEDDAVTTTDLPRLETFTYEVWFKRMADTGKDQVIMSDGNLFYTQAMFTLAVNSRDSICNGVKGEIVYHQAWDHSCSGVIAEIGKWYHVAVTRDAAGTRRIFVNGELRESEEDSPAPLNSSGTFTFGRAGDARASHFLGFIDEARISADALYDKDFTPSRAPLQAGANTVALWHFNEGDGQQTVDDSGNGEDGVLGSFTWPDSSDPIWLSESPMQRDDQPKEEPPETDKIDVYLPFLNQ